MSTVNGATLTPHPKPPGTGWDAVDQLDEQDLLAIAREAIWRVFRSQKAAAIELEVREVDLSKWLAGHYRDRLPLLTLLARHDAFRREFLVLAAVRAGLVVRRPDRRDLLRQIKTQMLALTARLDELEEVA